LAKLASGDVGLDTVPAELVGGGGVVFDTPRAPLSASAPRPERP